MSSGSFSASLAVGLATAFASTAAGQSTHLAQLERAAPAVALDPVASLAEGGWASAWMAPAGGGGSRGVLVGLEHRGFAGLTSVFAAARFRLGLRWQVGVAQTRLEDLFDPMLLEQYPGLAALGASATLVTLDALAPMGDAWLAGGLRYERDELLGEEEGGWAARLSAASPLPLGLRATALAERRLDGTGRATGRAGIGVARRLQLDLVGVTLGAGLTLGDLWRAEASRRVLSTSVRADLAGLLSLAGAVGWERDVYGADGWLGFAAFGLGLSIGPFGAHVRRGGQGDAQAAPTAVALLFIPEN